jgi:4-hydroxyphenylpyruvate dioxygenase-like putative hemolysin
MTVEPGPLRLHHVTFAVALERLETVTQFFTELGFVLEPAELTEPGLHIRLDWQRGIELISPIAGSSGSVAASVNEFLDRHGDGIYTVVIQVPGASAAESVAERYGATTRYRFHLEGGGTHVDENELSVFGIPLTLLDTNIP